MSVGLPSSAAISGRIQQADAFFDPCAVRARRLDARMRERLAESVRYVASQAAPHLEVPAASLASFLNGSSADP